MYTNTHRAMRYSPITNQNKPFKLFSKRFNRAEIESMKLGFYAHNMIMASTARIHYNVQKESFIIRIFETNTVRL
jgi:hypothetical protein